MATTFQEGFSISSPPLFTGFYYCFWRTKMIVFLNSINIDFVDILKNDFDLKRKEKSHQDLSKFGTNAYVSVTKPKA